MARYYRRRRFRRRPVRSRFRRFGRRRGYGRLRNRRRYGTSIRKQVQNQINRSKELGELSWQLSASGFYSIPNSWLEYHYDQSLLTQASGNNMFVGRSVFVKRFYIFGWMQGGQTQVVADDTHNFVRILIFRSPHDAGVGLLASYGHNLDSRICRTAHPTTQRWLRKKYCDTKFLLTCKGADADGVGFIPCHKFFKKRITFKGRGLKWDQGCGDHLVIAMISDSAAPPNPGFVLGWIVLQFHD